MRLFYIRKSSQVTESLMEAPLNGKREFGKVQLGAV